MTDIRDQRALAFPDEPYSAYCKVCWQNVYCLWIDKKDHHGGVCMFGHTKMQDCRQAMQWSETIGKIKSYVKKSDQKVTPYGKWPAQQMFRLGRPRGPGAQRQTRGVNAHAGRGANRL